MLPNQKRSVATISCLTFLVTKVYIRDLIDIDYRQCVDACLLHPECNSLTFCIPRFGANAKNSCHLKDKFIRTNEPTINGLTCTTTYFEPCNGKL